MGVVGAAEALHHAEGAGHRLAAGESAQAGRLDRRPVRHRVGERHSQLDYVGAGVRQRLEQGHAARAVGVAGGDERRQAGAPGAAQRGETAVDAGGDGGGRGHGAAPRRSATAATSLSPRPHMFMTSRLSRGSSGAARMTCASACAGSSAGTIPSSRAHNRNASSASSSVAET